jgi:hypothetical protein
MVCPIDARVPNDDSARELRATRLPLDGLPRLKSLVSGPDGAEILEELHQLLQRGPARARRFRRDLFARIRADPREHPDVAIVRDISASGVRLQLATTAQLDVMQARTVSIEMRLPGMPFVNCEAKLVRVIEHHKNGVDLAFSFSDSVTEDPALQELLEQLAADADAG